MHEVELAPWVLLVQLAVPLVRGCSIRANFDHGHLIQFPMVPLGVGLQRVYDKPLIGILLADLCPTHVNLLPDL